MPKRLAIVVAALAAAAVAGCGTSDPKPPVPVASTAPQAPGEALPIGECGAVLDADIAAATGLGDLRQITRNPLRCRWEAGDGSAVTFEWFRGSPIDTRTPIGAGDRVSAVRLADHPGKMWPADRSCEVAVSSGAGDFIDWKIDTAQAVGAQACSAVRQLATVTLQKAG
ncbi:DUF3558 family protein [Nocardia sp. NPDC051570]|uniref:DUF3558 family protein n=1 Tax=Nocardia sp. NPDC051570 TaxID=3364324 RepID=UPI0037A6C7F4